MYKMKIPESWAEAKLGEVLEIVAGATPKSDEKLFYCDNSKGIPWITPADLGKSQLKYISHGAKNISKAGFESCSTKILAEGSVLFSSRAPIGHIAIASNELCTNQGFKSIAKNENFESLYIYYYLKSIKSHIESMGSGTTFKEVSGSVMKEVPFLIAPKGEQKRIVIKIEECFKKINSVTKVLEKVCGHYKEANDSLILIEKLKTSILSKAFSGQLVPQDLSEGTGHQLLEKIILQNRASNEIKMKGLKSKL